MIQLSLSHTHPPLFFKKKEFSLLFVHLQEIMALKNTKIWYPTVLQSWLVKNLRECYSEGKVMSADCESLLNTLAAVRGNSSRQISLSQTQVSVQFFNKENFLATACT